MSTWLDTLLPVGLPKTKMKDPIYMVGFLVEQCGMYFPTIIQLRQGASNPCVRPLSLLQGSKPRKFRVYLGSETSHKTTGISPHSFGTKTQFTGKFEGSV